jgi:hypothetical protein
MTRLTVTRAADLQAGDRIVSVGPTITYRTPREVAAALAPIAPGSPVLGVRLVNPDPASPLELVLYPRRSTGLALVIERD